MMRLIKAFPKTILAGVLIGSAALPCASVLPAQSVAPLQRIFGKIDKSQWISLTGNTHPAANSKNDRGRVSPDLPMTDLILVLSRDPAQQAAFEQFVASQYDANSPNFHHWLTPEQVGEDFGPSEADIAVIRNWLIGQGLSVDQIGKNRLTIRFSGTASQVESTFHTEIHNLEVNGRQHIGNMSDPQIPAALGSVVVGPTALHNFFPRPAHHMGSQVTKEAASGKWTRTSTMARPLFGINGSSKGNAYLEEDISPYDFATIYNILPLWNASTPIDGTGQIIAIAGTSDIDVGQAAKSEVGANGNNDIATFRNYFGLPTTNPSNTPLRVSGNSQPLTVCTSTASTAICGIDDLVENSLDVEWSGAVAKNAQVVLVSSYPSSLSDDNLYDSESYIVDNIANSASPVYGAHILNVSYGECELGLGTSGNVEYYNLWQTAAAEGIAVFVAAGDSGSASCDDGYNMAASGLTVSGLASTPYNTAVGGTDFNWCDPDTAATSTCKASPYWSSTNTSTGANINTSGPQAGYVIETPWNESCANPLTLKWVQDAANTLYTISSTQIANVEQACNFVFDYSYGTSTNPGGSTPGLGYDYPYLEYIVQTVGGSGGASNCVVGNAVTNSKTGEMTGCTSAATGTGSVTIPSGATVASIPLTNDGWQKPSWQSGVTGMVGDGVRDLPDVSFFAADGYVSSSAYLMCASAVNSQNAQCSYSSYTEPFYQEVGGTSVATPAMAGVMALINQKAGAAQGTPNTELYKLASAQNYSECSAETVATSSKCYFNDIDKGTNAMPCEAGTLNCATTQDTLGSLDQIAILPSYSATTGYDMATGLGSLNVANVVNAWTVTEGTATAKITVTPAETSIFPNNTLSVTVTAQGANGSPQTSLGATVVPTGTVTLAASGSSYSATALLSTAGNATITIPANTLTAGAASTLTASYDGDAVYAANSGNTSVQVKAGAAPTPTITITPASTTLNSNASLGVTVTIGEGGSTPQGSVTLSSGGYSAVDTTAVSGVYSFTVPANSLSGTVNGQSDALTAIYSGDANYGYAPGTQNVTVMESTFKLAATQSAPVAPGSSATSTVTVSALNGYTGTVTLSCQQTGTTAVGGDGAVCSIPSTAVAMGGSLAATVTTSAAPASSSASLAHPGMPQNGWKGAGGGAILALLLILGMPARRRSWRQMLGALILMAALGSLAACGSGSTSTTNSTTGSSDLGTTAGIYTFTVQATGNPAVTPAVSSTFTVTVN